MSQPASSAVPGPEASRLAAHRDLRRAFGELLAAEARPVPSFGEVQRAHRLVERRAAELVAALNGLKQPFLSGAGQGAVNGQPESSGLVRVSDGDIGTSGERTG
jgi:hypothetical protein